MKFPLRTEKSSIAYEYFKRHHGTGDVCALCRKSTVVDFTYWRIVANEFPYDRVAKIHHMLIPKRHITETHMTQEELIELFEIKINHVYTTYHTIMEMTLLKKTIPEHFHLHLITFRDDLESVFRV